MNGWGRGIDTPARLALWLAGGLLLASLALLAAGYRSADARVHANYCLRAGPTEHGMALWSDDGGGHWYESRNDTRIRDSSACLRNHLDNETEEEVKP